MKEILLYGAMTGDNIVNAMIAFDSEEDITIRLNSGGGSPEDTFGLIAKMAEFKGKINVKVDGRAHSAAAFFLAYADNTTALDVSEFLIHRAAYGSWFENSQEFTDEIKGNLERVNTSLRKALESKIDVKRFEELKGVKMKEIFSLDGRLDVFLSAKEAKQVGLIDKIVKITPVMRQEIEQYGHQMAAEYIPKTELPKTESHIKNQSMTLEEFKAKHPELFAQVVAIGATESSDRIGAWMEFADVDIKVVKAGIESGKEITRKEIVALSRAEFAAASLAAASTEAPAADATATAEGTLDASSDAEKAEAAKLAEFSAKVNASLGLKNVEPQKA